MGVCILFSEAYLRNHPKADEKLIETQIAATLKQAPLQKGGVVQRKVNYLASRPYTSLNSSN